MPPYGFAKTKLTPEAEERYAATVERLGEAMRIARHIGRDVKVGVDADGELGRGRERDGVDPDDRRKDAVTAMCECGRRLRMAPSVYEQGPVICGQCGSAFSDGAERRAEPDAEIVDTTFVERRRAALDAEVGDASAPSERLVAVLDEERARL